MTASPVIDIRGLEVDYRRDGRVSHAVRGIDLEVARGERVAIVGESGSGKSTVALALLGLLPHNGHVVAGSAKVADVELAGASERIARRIRGRVVGLVPQDPTVSLNPTQRVGHQVAEAVRLRGVVKAAVDAEVIAALSQAGIDDPVGRARQYPHELSGGLRQRVLIAIALAGKPDVIVADEPTSALDVTVQRKILDHLDTLVRESGIALVIITHDLGVAADRADRVVVMQNGAVVETGTALDVLGSPREAYTRRLIAAAPGLSDWGSIRSGLAADVADAALASSVAVTVSGPDAVAAVTPALVRWVGVTKDFALPRGAASDALRAVDDVTLEAHAGRTLAIVGESGSGKTTLLRIALGLEAPTSGHVEFEGAEVSALSWRESRPLRRRFQLVQQNPFSSLDPRFSIERSIAEPLVSFGIGTRASRRARVAELLELVALPRDAATRRPAELSGGQRQRAAIARALAIEPELLYLDEPVSALDVSVQDQVLRLLARLQAELGVAYVLVSHDLGVVAQVAHEVAVVRGGRVLERGTTARVLGAPEHEYTRALLEAVPGRTLREAAA